jgi:hypothetical protein
LFGNGRVHAVSVVGTFPGRAAIKKSVLERIGSNVVHRSDRED